MLHENNTVICRGPLVFMKIPRSHLFRRWLMYYFSGE